MALGDVTFSGAQDDAENRRRGFTPPASPLTGRDRPVGATGLAPGHFRAWDVDGVTNLACLLGEHAATPVRGYGGWGQTPRVGRRAVTTFEGSETPAFAVELLLENERVPTPGGVRSKWRELERLAGWDRADDVPPPVIQWAANAPHHDYHSARDSEWVIEDLDWTGQNSDDRARLLWATATITVALYAPATVPGLTRARGFVRRELPAGWDLRDFAREHLGDATRWRDVRDLNRDDPRCPTTPHFKPSRPVPLLVPPREPKTKAKRRGRS